MPSMILLNHMNIEIEIKVKIDNFDLLKKSLPGFGKLIKSIQQIDEYYTPCQRDFFAQKPHPVEWLRIRTNPDKIIFEYDRSIGKREDGSQNYAQEYETEVKQPDEMRKILEFLDFKKVTTVIKQREYWDCKNFEVVLDNVKDLGHFVEVELKEDCSDGLIGRRKCMEFLEKLGIKITENDITKTGYPVLLMESKKIIKPLKN